jgi:Tfp pilus assembly protein PilO
MRSLGVVVIVSGFIVVWIAYAVYLTGYQAKRLASKQGRQEIKDEVTDTVTFMKNDKYFHKELNRELRGTYIVVGIVVVALIGTALGLG